MIPIAKPILEREEIEAVTKVLQSGTITQGSKVNEFEGNFAEYTETKYAVAVNSGTAALHVALLAHGIGKGDEVITTPFTFIATSNSILYTGAKPVFADIQKDTFNIDPDKIVEKITKKTKAILPVHLYGQPADMDEITKIAEEYDLDIIEDACQAHGAGYKGKKVGSFGTGTFSFYPTKNMTTGEGGMITTNDEAIAKKARLIREHGSSKRYYHEMLGYNYRMTDIAAAIGVEQLNKLESFNKKRIANATFLSKNLKDIHTIKIPEIRGNVKHVFHQYTIRTDDRDVLLSHLKNNGIGYGIYYPVPVHRQSLYSELGFDDKLPVTENAATEVVSLPTHPSLTEDDLKKITDTFDTYEEEKEC